MTAITTTTTANAATQQARIFNVTTGEHMNYNKIYASTDLACIAAKRLIKADPTMNLVVVPLTIIEGAHIDPRSVVGKMEKFWLEKEAREEKRLADLQAKHAAKHATIALVTVATEITPVIEVPVADKQVAKKGDHKSK